jgi:hypothetical protein
LRSAIPVDETQFLQISAASQWVGPGDRPAFWASIAAALGDQELGPGAITRAVYAAFAVYYEPIEVEEEPQQLRKLTYGSNKLEAKLDALEANRTRRQRSDTR